MGNLRLVLDVQASSGKQNASVHAKAALGRLLDELGDKRRVVVVRQRIRGRIARERRVDGKQLRLDLAGPSVHEGDRLWEYAVMGNQGPGLPFWICFPISAGSYSAEGMEALPSSKRTATWPTSLVITGPVTRVGKLTIDDTLRRSCKVMNADTSKSRTKISRKPINHQFK